MWKTCFMCGKVYETELDADPREIREKAIQEIYPEAEPYQLEQCITGICSDKCYDEGFGFDDRYTYDEKGRRFKDGERILRPSPLRPSPSANTAKNPSGSF